MDNLQEVCDQVTTEIYGYLDFSDELYGRATQPHMALKLMLTERAAWRVSLKTTRGALLQRRSPAEIELTDKIATPWHKRSPYFPMVNSAYPFDALGRHLEAKFPDVDFGKVLKAHRAAIDRSAGSLTGFRGIVGFILGLGTLILNAVPKPVVVEHLEWDHDDFQVTVFTITVGVLLYITLALGPVLLGRLRVRRRHDFALEVLEHLRLRQPGKAENGDD